MTMQRLPESSPEQVLDVPAERLKDRLGTFIDVAAMLAVAVGVGWGMWSITGPWAVAIGGVVLAFLSGVSSASRRPRPTVPVESEPAPDPELAPGPEHPGTLHIAGR